MISDKLVLNVRLCDDATKDVGDPDCATDPDEIANYIKDIMLESWVVHEKIFFGKYFDGESKPTYFTSDMLNESLLDATKL